MKGEPISENDLDDLIEVIILPQIKSTPAYALNLAFEGFATGFAALLGKRFTESDREAYRKNEIKEKFRKLERLLDYPGKEEIVKSLLKAL